MTDPALERRLRTKIKGRVHRFAAVVPPGFEQFALEEMEAAGIDGFEPPRKGVLFWQGKTESFWLAHALCRIPVTFRWQVAEFGATGFAELRRKCERVEWDLFLPEGAPVRISVAAESSRLWHEGAIAEEVVAALAKSGHASSDDEEAVPLFCRMERDRCALFLEGDGAPLYRRGFEKRVLAAPLRDNVAWALLQAAGISEAARLCDPMCGSGSFSLEAFLAVRGLHPARLRRFGFESWPSTRLPAWENLKSRLPARHPFAPESLEILCSDADPDAVAAATANFLAAGSVAAAGPGPAPAVGREDFFDLKPEKDGRPSLLVLNPPWGKRIRTGDGPALYREIGAKIRADFRSWKTLVLAPGLEFERALGLRWDRKILFRSGGIGVGALIGKV